MKRFVEGSGDQLRYVIRNDWRILCLLPCITFLALLVAGVWFGPYLFLGHIPDFGPITLTTDAAKLKAAVGFELAAREQIVTTAFMLFIAAALLIGLSVRTVWSIVAEFHNDAVKTDADRADYFVGLGLVVAGMAAVGLFAAMRSNYCGATDSHHLYRCFGKGIIPELIMGYLQSIAAGIDNLQGLLDTTVDLTNIAVVAAGASLLLALLLLPRGFDRTIKTSGGGSAPEPIRADELKRWLTNRTRSLNALSLLTALVLVAGIAQMFSWMSWPMPLMSKDLLQEGTTPETLHDSYEALVNGVLQFHAVWFGLLVAALIFPTNVLLFYKCRVLGRQIIADAKAVVVRDEQWLAQNAQLPLEQQDQDNAALATQEVAELKTEIEAADGLIDQANAEATFKGYFDSYRGYLLALAPAIVQKLLEIGG
jgi:hypothetical protein